MKKKSTLHNNLSILQGLKVSSANLQHKHWYDPVAAALADFLTSTLLIIIVMLCFLAGIASHIEAVFGSWFLAVGFQSVVLLTSVNSDLLPKYKQLPLIAVAMSVCTFIFVFLSFDGHLSNDVMLIVNIIKSLAISGVEFIFAYLFVARNNRTKAERSGYQFDLEGNVVVSPFDDIDKTEIVDKPATQQIDSEQLGNTEKTEIAEVATQTTQLTQDAQTAKPASFHKCACGEVFDNDADFEAHTKHCETWQWFNASN